MTLQRAARVGEDGDSIWGLLEAGDYGFSSDLINVGTFERSYRREVDDAELIPFYFILDAPANTDKGLLIVQRYGNRGVYTEFTTALRAAFDTRFPDYLLDIRRHVPRVIIDTLRQGSIKTIQLTSYELSDDLADKIQWKGNRDSVKEIAIIIKAQRKGSLPRPAWLDKMMKSNDADVYEVPDSLSDTAQSVRVAVSYLGKQRFIDLEQQEKIAPYVDVSDEVKLSATGHPEFESVHKSAQSLLFDLMKEIGRPG